jgi:hypothetical protein
MLQVQADWTTLIVIVVMAAVAAIALWQRAKEHAACVRTLVQGSNSNDAGWAKQVNDVLTEHEEYKSHMHAAYKGEMDKLLKQYQDTIDKQAHGAAGQIAIRDLMIKEMLPNTIHIASIREATPAGDKAARLVYITNCLGILAGTQELGRVLARGQYVSKCTPAEINRLFSLIEKEQHPLMEVNVPERVGLGVPNTSENRRALADEFASVGLPAPAEQPLVSIGQGTSQTEVAPADI